MFFKIAITSLSVSIVRADNPLAVQDCRTLLHSEIEANETNYLNYKCKLVCNVQNKLIEHLAPDGNTCPDLVGTQFSNRLCKAGKCDPYRVPLGYIDLEIVSAQLNQTANAFAEVFIQNSTNVTLPVTNKTEGCYWITPIVQNTTHPVWSFFSNGTHDHKWSEHSELIFKLWDQISLTQNYYVGSGTVTIHEILSDGVNNETVGIPIYSNSGFSSSKINAHITWTQIN